MFLQFPAEEHGMKRWEEGASSASVRLSSCCYADLVHFYMDEKIPYQDIYDDMEKPRNGVQTDGSSCRTARDCKLLNARAMLPDK